MSDEPSPTLKWERIRSIAPIKTDAAPDDAAPEVWRSKVPGGWLVMEWGGPNITFYPDPNHDWDGGSLD